MNPIVPPWCLHWQPGGELDPSDRFDLFFVVATLERGWSRQILNEALSKSTPSAQITPTL